MPEEAKNVSLVLSIFKGVNFINQRRDMKNLGIKIMGKLNNVPMETGIFPLDAGPEITFNSQIAWIFSPRDLQTLRVEKKNIKLEVLLVNCGIEQNPVISKLGYVVLFVHDAFVLNSISEINILNAKEVSLLGATHPWRELNLKLLLLLHIEDPNKVSEHCTSPKPTLKARRKSLKTSQERLHDFQQQQQKERGVEKGVRVGERDAVDSSAPPLPPFDAQMEAFKAPIKAGQWRVNEEKGYFELGQVSNNDDLFIMNVILISATYLHLLPGSKASSDDEWIISFKSFGCEIKSEQFKLRNQDEKRHTFIGDKSTARIRASGAEFHNWLKNTSLEFQVKKLIGENNFQTLGVSFVQLLELTRPDVKQLKITLELVSDRDTVSSSSASNKNIKPEIRILIELEAYPNYFKEPKPQPVFAPKSLEVSQLFDEPDLGDGDGFNSNNISNEFKVGSDNESLMHDIMDQMNALNISKDDKGISNSMVTNLVKQINSRSNLDNKISPPKVPNNKELLPTWPPKSSKDSIPAVPKASPKSLPIKSQASPGQTAFHPSKSPPIRSSGQYSMPSEDKQLEKIPPKVGKQQNQPTIQNLKEKEVEKDFKMEPELLKKGPASPKRILEADKGPTSILSNLSRKEIEKFPPGSYTLLINLKEFWLKVKSPIKNSIDVSYDHLPFGITSENRISCLAKQEEFMESPENSRKMHFPISKGSWRVFLDIDELSEELKGDPMQIEFRHISRGLADKNPFAYSPISIGKVFLQTPRQKIRFFDGIGSILKPNSDGTNTKVGEIAFEVILQPAESNKDTVDNFLVTETLDLTPVKSTHELINLHERMASPVPPSPQGSIQSERGKSKDRLAFEKWRKKEEEDFQKYLKQKEKQYLTVLSDEWKKRDHEREEFVCGQMKEFAKKEEEIRRKESHLAQKEEDLSQQNRELKDRVHESDIDKNKMLSESEIEIKRLKETHKYEIDSLNKRIGDYKGEIEKLKGDVLILQGKVHQRDLEIESLLESRNKWPDVELEQKYKLLEQKHQNLLEKLGEANKMAEIYKSKIKYLADEQKALKQKENINLKSENENLRLQLLATNEKKALASEYNEIKSVGTEIRALKRSYSNKFVDPQQVSSTRTRKSDPSGEKREEPAWDGRFRRHTVQEERVDKEKEVGRLIKHRDELLQTGAYQEGDPIMIDLRKKIDSIIAHAKFNC